MFGDILHNWDFVGRCYNVLSIDPLNIEAGDKFAMCFDTGDPDQDFDTTNDGSAKKPKCTDYIPATGGRYDANNASILSSYDFQRFTKNEGSVNVSDPTGDLFATTLSSSFTKSQQETGSLKKVVNYTSQIINCYKLQMKTKGLKLHEDLIAAIQEISSAEGTFNFQDFVQRFGTHYANSVLFGGRVYQQIIINQADYSTFLEEGINVSLQAKLSFEVAKGGASATHEDKRSDKFVRATEGSATNTTYVGGIPQQMFDMWAMNICERPGPIKVDLQPIYSLLTAEYFPDDDDISKRYQRLKKEIEGYIQSQGKDVRQDCLRYGDEVSLCLVSNRERYLAIADGSNKIQTSKAVSLEGLEKDAILRWVVINTKDPHSEEGVKMGDTIALHCKQNGLYLDAQSGSDNLYDVGDGLAGVSSSNPSKEPKIQWKIVFVGDSRLRSEVIEGDYIKLKSQWLNDDKEYGCLQGETNFDDPEQRVYSFGKERASKGIIWRIQKLP